MTKENQTKNNNKILQIYRNKADKRKLCKFAEGEIRSCTGSFSGQYFKIHPLEVARLLHVRKRSESSFTQRSFAQETRFNSMILNASFK